MNLKQIKNKILFTLDKKKFLKENKQYVRKMNYVEFVSISLYPLFFLLSTLCFDELNGFHGFLGGFAVLFYFMAGLTHSDGDIHCTPSYIPNIFSPFNFLFSPILNKNVNEMFGLKIKKAKHYNKIVKSKNKKYFYEDSEEIQELIENNNTEEAFYYWSQIDKQSKDMKEKQKARKQIRLLQYQIESHNEEIEKYNKESKHIDSILEKNNIYTNNNQITKKIEKIKILNI